MSNEDLKPLQEFLSQLKSDRAEFERVGKLLESKVERFILVTTREMYSDGHGIPASSDYVQKILGDRLGELKERIGASEGMLTKLTEVLGNSKHVALMGLKVAEGGELNASQI